MITDTLAVPIWLLVLFVAAPLFGACVRLELARRPSSIVQRGLVLERAIL